MDFLENIVREKRSEVESLKRAKRIEEFYEEALDAPSPLDFRKSLGEGVSIIAEVKRKSPSKGVFSAIGDAVRLSLLYEENGARAISVLTDREHFGGSVTDLEEVRRAVRIPLLRKDFLIDPVQVFESRIIGADAFLLITSLLEERLLGAMIGIGEELGMSALVEVHTVPELEKALRCGAGLIGINSRDLRTFNVDIRTGIELIGKIPPGIIAVAESGIATEFDIAALTRAGFRTFLIGEALVTSTDPGEKLRDFLAAAEAAVRGGVGAG
ncbi:MAG: indole-3-glycerol phosphate synthase TrpC [Candidatus Glassbacteria bacterium]